MANLIFKSPDLKRVVNHMLANPRSRPYSNTDTTELGLTLVKDDGIYIFSSANALDHWVEGPVKRHVVYAEGFDPTLRAEAPNGKKYYRRHDGVWTDGDKEEYECLTALQKATYAVCNDTEHVWDDCRDAVGGDDFAEWIELSREDAHTLTTSREAVIEVQLGKDTYRTKVK